MRHLFSQINEVREIMSSISSDLSRAIIFEGFSPPTFSYVVGVSRSIYDRFEHLIRDRLNKRRGHSKIMSEKREIL